MSFIHKLFLHPLILIILTSNLVNAQEYYDINKLIIQKHLNGIKKIIVPTGTYISMETIKFDKSYSGTELVADKPVIIISRHSGPVFALFNVYDMQIIGFRLEGIFGKINVATSTTSDQLIQSNLGISVIDSNNININKNIISNFWKGIYVTSSKATCSNIIISNNVISKCGYHSIAAHKGLDDYTYTNRPMPLIAITVYGNDISECEQGPVFRGVTNGKIENNDVYNNINGIRIEQSDFNIVRNNSIHNNLISGITIYNGSKSNTVVQNRIFNNNLQVDKILGIELKHGITNHKIPGDIKCFDSITKSDYKKYTDIVNKKSDLLEYNQDFWPFPTAYEYVSPGVRFGKATKQEINKYWGIYYCQAGGVGIELRNKANLNKIINNLIYNTLPISTQSGYTMYGIRLSQLNLVDPEQYASRKNIISGNRIYDMIKGGVLDDNAIIGVAAENIFNDNIYINPNKVH